jgi:pimeloyl-ACP methyl ester carboxylesterase
MADGVGTRYRRCGVGPTVVVLEAEPVVDALAGSFRVIAPEAPLHLADTTAAGRARWLSGVFDGLGIEVAVIVTTPMLADAVGLFADGAPDRVKGVVLAAGDPAGTRAAVGRCFG